MKEFDLIFNNACSHIEQVYIDREFIENEWQIVKKYYDAKIRQAEDEAKFVELMKKLLQKELELSHCDFFTPSECEKNDSLDQGEEIPEYYNVSHFSDDDFFYLKMPTLSIPIFQIGKIRECLEEVKDEEQTIIIDLRLNSGGAMSATGDVLSFFLEDDTPYLQTKLADWKNLAEPEILYPFPEKDNMGNHHDVVAVNDKPWTVWHTHKKMDKKYVNPLIVLSDENNYSCGEVFAQSLKENKRAIIIGKKSSGSVVGCRDDFECGEGFRLSLPFVNMESVEGYIIERNSVIPHIEYEFKTPFTDALSVEEIREIIKLSDSF